jgi:hypothetical protein
VDCEISEKKSNVPEKMECEFSEKINNVPEKMDCEFSEKINNVPDKWIVKLVRENQLTIGMINGLSN